MPRCDTCGARSGQRCAQGCPEAGDWGEFEPDFEAQAEAKAEHDRDWKHEQVEVMGNDGGI